MIPASATVVEPARLEREKCEPIGGERLLTRRDDERVLVMAPVGQDAAAMAALLYAQGFQTQITQGPADCSRQIAAGAGALLLTEEALELPQLSDLLAVLEAQPPWSELPLIILTSGGESRLRQLLDLTASAARSVTLLERPIATATLSRSVQVALNSRRRQYQVRDLLEREQRIQQEQQKLIALIEHSPDFIAVADLNGKVVFVNRAGQQLVGVDGIDGAEQTTILDYFAPQERSHVEREILPTLLARHHWEGEVTFHQFKTGELIPVLWNAFVIPDVTSGAPAYFACVSTDIREKKKAEARLRRQRDRVDLLYQTAANLLVTTEPAATIQGIFKELQQQLGIDVYFNYLVNEKGNALCLHSYGGFSEQLAREISRLDFGQAVCGTVASERRSRVLSHVHECDSLLTSLIRSIGVRAYASYPLLSEDRLLGTLSFGSRRKDQFAEDELEFLETLTQTVALGLDRSRLVFQLRLHADELQQRVAERTATLEESLRSLEGVLYHVAHDLRAPLRAMNSYTELLLHNYATHFDEQGRTFARRIGDASVKMDLLIRDLLAYGRLGHQKLTVTSLNLETVISKVLRELEHDIQSTNALVTVESPLPHVPADPAVLEQVLTNLVSNALKFVPPGTPPQVRIWADSTPQCIRLYIQDNGIGIAAEHHDRIFGIFERLHNGGSFPGTGIGLAIVKKGMDRLHGRVGVDSSPGRGSRFWLEFDAGS